MIALKTYATNHALGDRPVETPPKLPENQYPKYGLQQIRNEKVLKNLGENAPPINAVSYTHLTLPTNREV